MQVQGGREKPFVFVSHTLSEQTFRWARTAMELCAFVFSVKNLAPYLLGALFTVRMDHNNLVYNSNLTAPELVRWTVLLSEFHFHIEHIPGAQNVVSDRLTRIFKLDYEILPENIKYFHREDTIFFYG